MSEFNRRYKEDVKYIEGVFETYSKYHFDCTKELSDACNYALFSGGKRIRPVIMLETFRCFSDELRMIEPFFMAISMIHTYSLIHDDLPILDDDDLRRGKPTVHKVYGDDVALLAGDVLLNKAFEVMADGSIRLGLGERGLRAISVLGEKSGERGMAGGQFVDVKNDGMDLDKDTLDFIHEHKTSALLEAAFMLGAIIGGADDGLIHSFERVGKSIGMAFQIQDDILDVCSTTEHLGKPVGSDKKNAKSTFVDVYGMEKSQERYKAYYNEARNIVANMDLDTQFLEDLISFLESRDK